MAVDTFELFLQVEVLMSFSLVVDPLLVLVQLLLLSIARSSLTSTVLVSFLFVWSRAIESNKCFAPQ